MRGHVTTHFGLRRLRAGAVVAVAALAATLVLSGCGGVQIKAEDHVPTPLVDELPVRCGVFYSPDFRAFSHKEERWGTTWEVALGGAHVTKLDRLLHAMFPQLVDVPDLAKPPQPALDLILEPRFEEYSFVTPRDAGAEYYAVTIKYRLNLYDGEARLLDSLVYTGYGNTPASGLSTEKPLLIATERAMRDAGAKFATEFAEQATVQKLLRGEKPEPLPTGGAGSAGGGIGEVGPPTGPPPTAAGSAPAGAPTGAAGSAPAGTPGGTPPASTPGEPASATPGGEASPAPGASATPAPSEPPPSEPGSPPETSSGAASGSTPASSSVDAPATTPSDAPPPPDAAGAEPTAPPTR